MDDDREQLLPKGETSFFEEQVHGKSNYGSLGHRLSGQRDDIPNTSRRQSICDSGVEELSSGCVASLNVVGLSYTVKEKPGHWWNGSCFRTTRKKQVLSNLCMTFKSGELTALVGSSGSGKTSLLDVMSGRAQGEVNGVVSYKHEQCTRGMMRQKSSYVLQADRLLPTLTVRETLTYMAYLKLPGSMGVSEIDAKVQSVIMNMGLLHVADNRIGGAVVRGVSGGEKRRITIGVQLLKDPEILLLDEPTSGLDSFTARHLVSSLADLAHKGMLVIMSIHQPRSDIFNLLDKLAILTIGRLSYFGSPKELVPYFTRIGHPCPRDQNPCDVYIDLTSVDRRTPHREKCTLQNAVKLCNIFGNSELQASIVRQITSGLNHHYNDSFEMDGRRKSQQPSWPRKFHSLLNRLNVHLYRDRASFIGRLIYLPFFIPFILMFLGRLGNNQGSIQDRLGIIYQATQVTPYMGLTNGIALVPVLRELFYRECHDGLYSTQTFLFAYYVHCLPFNIITCSMFCSILYWAAGLNDDLVVFGSFVLVCVMLIQFGEMMTLSILGILRNTQLANNTTALVFSASGLLASGLLRAVENMPSILQWAGYIAIHKYSTEIVVANEFHNAKFECEPHEQGQQCLETGDEYIDLYYPGSLDHMTRNFVLMGGYSLAIFIFSVIMFKVRGIPTLH